MSTSQIAPDHQWELLAAMPELKRIDVMMERYAELADTAEDERLQRLYMMAMAESNLPEDRLFDMTKSRLRAWTRMDQRAAHTVARDYYPVLHELGARAQERFKSTEQRVFDSLPWEQKRLSLNFIPNDEGYVPDLVESVEPENAAEVPGADAARQEEIEERAYNRWERFRAWVGSMTRPA